MNDAHECHFSVKHDLLRLFSGFRVRRDSGEIIFKIKKTYEGWWGDTNGFVVSDATGKRVASAVRVLASSDLTDALSPGSNHTSHEEGAGHIGNAAIKHEGLKDSLVRRFDHMATCLMGRVSMEVRNETGDKIALARVVSWEPAEFCLVWGATKYSYPVPTGGGNNIFKHRTVVMVDGQKIAHIKYSSTRWTLFTVCMADSDHLLPVLMLCLCVHLFAYPEGTGSSGG